MEPKFQIFLAEVHYPSDLPLEARAFGIRINAPTLILDSCEFCPQQAAA